VTSLEDRSAGMPEDELRALARKVSELLITVHAIAREEPVDQFVERVQSHLGVDPRDLPVVSEEFPPYQLIDVNIALEKWPDSTSQDRSVEIVGISGDQRRFHPLSELLGGSARFGVGIGPVDYTDLADSPDSTRSCVRFGLFLLRDNNRSAAALLRGPDPHGPMQQAMIELIAEDRSFAHNIIEELKKLALDHSVLRGQVVGLGHGEGNRYGGLLFMRRPTMARSELVLPSSTLAQIERHVMGIATHSQRLQEAHQHLKRGVLLYVPPGTGKTHTIRFLLSELRHTTAFVLSGQALMLIGQACGLARLMQPSLVILEDVDLIAPDRSMNMMGPNPVLFEVLNQIDGLGDDVDVTFLLTTNRVDILERALAERPGRVDAAIEIAVPNDGDRLRLFRLYGAELGVHDLDDAELSAAIAGTSGRTATYIREVVRRAALIVAERNATGPLRVSGADLAAAASELLDDRAGLTRSLLGGAEEPDAEPPFPGRPPFGGMPSVAHMRAFGPRSGPGEPPAPFAPS
jgi:cell division protease FtsH